MLAVHHLGDDVLGRQIGIHRDHVSAMHHHIGHGEIAQVENSADHVAMLAFDAAFLVMQRHRAANLVVGASTLSICSGLTPNRNSSLHTSHCTPATIGAATATILRSGAATARAARSVRVMASVLGRLRRTQDDKVHHCGGHRTVRGPSRALKISVASDRPGC